LADSSTTDRVVTPDSDHSAAAPTRSAAEQRTAARIGGVLFRNRSWLPVPFLLVVLLMPGKPTPLRWVICAAMVIAGEWIRLAGIAAAGTVTRRRSREVQRLVNYGIFAWVRNPLYVGNFLIWMGFVVASGVLWFLPMAMLIFAAEYSFIVAYEEGVLESIFGDEYVRYKAVVPRWIPRPPAAPVPGQHDWREAVVSERSTFLQYLGLVAVFLAKARWGRVAG
jgi:protein-S-isoprenylcysteine O-methyltransferase Ste14